MQPRVSAGGAARADRGDAPRRRARGARDGRSPRAGAVHARRGRALRRPAAARTPPRRWRRWTCRRRAPSSRATSARRASPRRRPCCPAHACSCPRPDPNTQPARWPNAQSDPSDRGRELPHPAVAHRPQPPPAALARGGRAGDPRRRRPVLRREPRPGRSGAGARPGSTAPRRSGVLRRTHGRRRHHVADIPSSRSTTRAPRRPTRASPAPRPRCGWPRRRRRPAPCG